MVSRLAVKNDHRTSCSCSSRYLINFLNYILFPLFPCPISSIISLIAASSPTSAHSSSPRSPTPTLPLDYPYLWHCPHAPLYLLFVLDHHPPPTWLCGYALPLVPWPTPLLHLLHSPQDVHCYSLPLQWAFRYRLSPLPPVALTLTSLS